MIYFFKAVETVIEQSSDLFLEQIDIILSKSFHFLGGSFQEGMVFVMNMYVRTKTDMRCQDGKEVHDGFPIHMRGAIIFDFSENEIQKFKIDGFENSMLIDVIGSQEIVDGFLLHLFDAIHNFLANLLDEVHVVAVHIENVHFFDIDGHGDDLSQTH